jgi:hypothetical protein
MSSLATHLGALSIAVAGILIAVGTRRVGWRALAVGVVLIVAATLLSSPHIVTGGIPNVAGR